MKLSKHPDIAPSLKHLLVGLYEDHAYFIEKLHDELFDMIKPAADVYIKEQDCSRGRGEVQQENVADVFVKMKEKFLMYAPFIVYCDNVERMIGLMRIDANVRDSIKTLEVFLKTEMERTGNFNIPSSFNSLLAFPFQHVIRYCSFYYCLIVPNIDNVFNNFAFIVGIPYHDTVIMVNR